MCPVGVDNYGSYVVSQDQDNNDHDNDSQNKKSEDNSEQFQDKKERPKRVVL